MTPAYAWAKAPNDTSVNSRLEQKVLKSGSATNVEQPLNFRGCSTFGVPNLYNTHSRKDQAVPLPRTS